MTEDTGKLSTRDIAAASEQRQAAEARAEAVHEPTSRPIADETPPPLFGDDEAGGYRTRWGAIQTGFVDEPRRAVEEADALVAEVMTRLAEVFASERRQLEGQWERKEKVSTEDLRVAMRRYRSFFERLLAI
jgi:hypothetical protein